VYLTSNREVILGTDGHPKVTPLETVPESLNPVLVGTLNHVTVYGVRQDAVSNQRTEPLRPALIRADHQTFLSISGASQVLDFVDEHRFCGRCGHSTRANHSDRGLQCPQCELRVYPRISPCVIVLITRGDEILLARAPRFVDGMYSTLAGFIEAGESAEHATHREIFEEIGVEIHAPVYQGSQSWPFKHSLMLGYRAEYAGGEIQVDGVEIVDAQWFHLDRLPTLPPHASISRGMIEAYRQARGFSSQAQ
jgi:NAD+ diphosphatase